MTIVTCKHENTTKDHGAELEIDGVVFDVFGEHEICFDCQSHIDCPLSCKEHKKYLRMMGVDVDFTDGKIPF